MITKKANNKWLVDVQPNGRASKRYRKTLDTKAEALRYEAWVREKTRVNPNWSNRQDNDPRRLTDLINQWYELHGQNLRSAQDRMKKLITAATAMDNPLARRFTADNFIHYRSKRLEDKITANTLNHELAYLKAVFNELMRIDKWKHDNPLNKVKPLKFSKRELAFLTSEQIKILLIELARGRNKDTLLVAKICLATGARWGEAEGLRREHIQSNRITFTDTKNGKNRILPISPELCEEVTKNRTGQLFSSCSSAFKHAIKRCEIKLPTGQLTHILRHTFASHFIMNGGNILVLQKILGHSTIELTMRYAHLAPEYLETVTQLNPLTMLADC